MSVRVFRRVADGKLEHTETKRDRENWSEVDYTKAAKRLKTDAHDVYGAIDLLREGRERFPHDFILAFTLAKTLFFQHQWGYAYSEALEAQKLNSGDAKNNKLLNACLDKMYAENRRRDKHL